MNPLALLPAVSVYPEHVMRVQEDVSLWMSNMSKNADLASDTLL